ncbi:AMP-binding protein, partial [Rhizobium sp. TRM95111]|uniref:AMP-binding protein n=1 Tax=Rhizobium alarense TaxID=2846851 RepID=UPI001F3AD2D0
MPLTHAVLAQADARPDAAAFRIGPGLLTYGQLAALASALFEVLERLSPAAASASRIGAAARLVAIETGNHPLFPAAFAAASAGINCAALIDPGLPQATRRRMLAALAPDVTIRAEDDDLLLQSGTGTERFSRASGASGTRLPEGDGAAPFLVVFTSGTTADPKPIIRDRRSWRQSLVTGAGFFGIDAASTTFSPGPLAHGLALYAMTETLAAGGE